MQEEVVTKEMRDARRGLLINFLLITAMIIGMLYWQYNKAKVKKSILLNPHYSSAYIVKISTRNGKGGHKTAVTYQFSTSQGNTIQKTKLYNTSGRKIKLPSSCYHHLIGKNIPILYSPEFEESAHLLLLRYDFSRYGLNFPDSLLWTEPILYGLPHYTDGSPVPDTD